MAIFTFSLGNQIKVTGRKVKTPFSQKVGDVINSKAEYVRGEDAERGWPHCNSHKNMAKYNSPQ